MTLLKRSKLKTELRSLDEIVRKYGFYLPCQAGAPRTGCRLLHAASAYGLVDLVDLLLKELEYPVVGGNLHAAVHYAARWAPEAESLDVLKSLIRANFPVNDIFGPPCSPLQAAAMGNKGKEMFELLLQNHTLDYLPWGKNEAPLLIVMKYYRSPLREVLMKLLLEKSSGLAKRDQAGRKAAHIASIRNDYGFIKPLWCSKSDLSATDGFGFTPLHLAVINQHLDLAMYMLEIDSSLIDITDNYGRTPNQCAADANMLGELRHYHTNETDSSNTNHQKLWTEVRGLLPHPSPVLCLDTVKLEHLQYLSEVLDPDRECATIARYRRLLESLDGPRIEPIFVCHACHLDAALMSVRNICLRCGNVQLCETCYQGYRRRMTCDDSNCMHEYGEVRFHSPLGFSLYPSTSETERICSWLDDFRNAAHAPPSCEAATQSLGDTNSQPSAPKEPLFQHLRTMNITERAEDCEPLLANGFRPAHPGWQATFASIGCDTRPWSSFSLGRLAEEAQAFFLSIMPRHRDYHVKIALTIPFRFRSHFI